MEKLIKEIHDKICRLEKDVRSLKEKVCGVQDAPHADGGEMGKILSGAFVTDRDVFKVERVVNVRDNKKNGGYEKY